MKAFLYKINLFNCKTLPRKVFTFYFTALMIGALLLMLPIARTTGKEPTTFINAAFTAASAFSNAGLSVYNTGQYFSLFGEMVILILMQAGGLGLMTIKVMFFLFLGKKIGIKDRISVTSERGDGKNGGTVALIKTALICVFVIEGIATILFTLRYYFCYFDNPIFDRNIFKVIYQGVFASVSAVNNGGIDILGGNSLEMFANDYFIQTLTMICLIIGGLGFPIFYDVRNFIVCKKEKTKFHLSYFSKFVLRIYFGIAIIGIAVLFSIELTIGTQRIFYIIFNSFSARNAGFYTVNMNKFAEGSQIVLALLMWIGSAPASTGGGIRVTTFYICILSIIAHSRNKKEINFLGRRIPEETVSRSLVVAFISQILVFIASIVIVSCSNSITFLQAFFESCSAFGVTGLSLGITTSLNTLGKITIIVLMFAGQLGVSNVLLMWSNNKKHAEKTTLPEEDILIN